MILLRCALAAAVLLALAACSGPRIVRSDLGMMYSTGELFAAADGRDLRTVVQGNPFDLCDKKTWTTAPAMRPIVVRAAFCILGREQSAVTGYLDQATGPDDPNFTSLIRNLTIQLFPYVLPVPFGRPDFG